jgi:hypothetical protein
VRHKKSDAHGSRLFFRSRPPTYARCSPRPRGSRRAPSQPQRTRPSSRGSARTTFGGVSLSTSERVNTATDCPGPFFVANGAPRLTISKYTKRRPLWANGAPLTRWFYWGPYGPHKIAAVGPRSFAPRSFAPRPFWPRAGVRLLATPPTVHASHTSAKFTAPLYCETLSSRLKTELAAPRDVHELSSAAREPERDERAYVKETWVPLCSQSPRRSQGPITPGPRSQRAPLPLPNGVKKH